MCETHFGAPVVFCILSRRLFTRPSPTPTLLLGCRLPGATQRVSHSSVRIASVRCPGSLDRRSRLHRNLGLPSVDCDDLYFGCSSSSSGVARPLHCVPDPFAAKKSPPNTAFHKVSDRLLFLRHSKMRRVRAGSRLLNHFRRVMLMWIQKLSLMVSDPIHVTEM